jgi:YidC/Oxa1 family membrane protein insertase
VDNRRLFLAVLLSLAVVMIWPFLWQKLYPAPPRPPEAPVTAPAGTESPAAAPAPAPGIAVPAPPAVNAASAGNPGGGNGAAAAAGGPPISAAREEQVVLEAGRLRAVFTNRGAQLVSLQLREERKGLGAVELVRPRAAGNPYPYALTDRTLQALPVDGALFAVERKGGGRAATFRYSGPLGSAEKRFRFDERDLLEATIEVPGRSDWGVLLGPGIRNPTADELKSRYQLRAAVYKAGDEVQLVDPARAEERRQIAGANLSWAGLEDSYFLVAAIPREGVDRVVLQPMLLEPGADGKAARIFPLPEKKDLTKEQKDLPHEMLVVLEPKGDRLTLLSYWGSKEYERLKALPYGLEATVRLGYFGVVARPLLLGLHWIHDNVVANYGWAIILMTVLIKVALLPLTHRSYVSMRKMQEMNPKVQGIRDRYRAKMRDKQGRPNLESQRKMNEEIMALYKSEGVNPAGGCLPMLLQLPILFAFYSMLTAAYELRQAPWILWIHDLSARDPIYILPIVMAGTQFLQQRMTPMAGDPAQRLMFQMMPLFMLFFFLPSPSGLVLYWLTNNVLTMIQQGVYNHLKSREAA